MVISADKTGKLVEQEIYRRTFKGVTSSKFLGNMIDSNAQCSVSIKRTNTIRIQGILRQSNSTEKQTTQTPTVDVQNPHPIGCDVLRGNMDVVRSRQRKTQTLREKNCSVCKSTMPRESDTTLKAMTY